MRLLFCHGLEGTPHGRKVQALRAAGIDVLAPDFQGMPLRQRIDHLAEEQRASIAELRVEVAELMPRVHLCQGACALGDRAPGQGPGPVGRQPLRVEAELLRRGPADGGQDPGAHVVEGLCGASGGEAERR